MKSQPSYDRNPQLSEDVGDLHLCTIHDCEMFLVPDVTGQREPAWSCPQCYVNSVNRRAAADHETHDRERRLEKQRAQQAELERRIGAASIPPRYRQFTFHTFPANSDRARAACAALRSYANRWDQARLRGVSILISGSVGTGKTGLACAVGNHIMENSCATVLFMTAYGAVRHIRDTWGRKSKSESEALDDLLKVDLLILDEIGANVGSDTEMSILFEVLNGRYAHQVPTILCSNLPLKDFDGPTGRRPGLSTYLGQRIIDRFSDDQSFTLAMDWPSLRGATK